MDNESFHHTERITQMCADAVVKLIYLPPYSPDLNPIEEFFAKLKSFIKRSWCYYEEIQMKDLIIFLIGALKQLELKGRVLKVISGTQGDMCVVINDIFYPICKFQSISWKGIIQSTVVL